MNENLKKGILLYAMGEKTELRSFLEGLSKPTLEGLFIDLLTMYFNDKNSSTLREIAAIYIAGYEPTFEKLGYNGYRQVMHTNQVEYCEVKPQNTDSPNKKLNGGGNFSDYTPERFSNDLGQNPKILVCGYVEGRLVYIIEFDFNCLKERIEKQLALEFGEEMRREPGQYLRSLPFSFRDYEGCENKKVVYVSKDLHGFRNYISRDLFSYLEKHVNHSESP